MRTNSASTVRVESETEITFLGGKGLYHVLDVSFEQSLVI